MYACRICRTERSGRQAQYCSPSRALTASQWCVRLKYVWTEPWILREKKNYNNKPHRRSYTVCLSISQHIDYRGLLSGFDIVAVFLSPFIVRQLKVLIWQATQNPQPSQGSVLCKAKTLLWPICKGQSTV